MGDIRLTRKRDNVKNCKLKLSFSLYFVKHLPFLCIKNSKCWTDNVRLSFKHLHKEKVSFWKRVHFLTVFFSKEFFILISIVIVSWIVNSWNKILAYFVKCFSVKQNDSDVFVNTILFIANNRLIVHGEIHLKSILSDWFLFLLRQLLNSKIFESWFNCSVRIYSPQRKLKISSARMDFIP